MPNSSPEIIVLSSDDENDEQPCSSTDPVRKRSISNNERRRSSTNSASKVNVNSSKPPTDCPLQHEVTFCIDNSGPKRPDLNAVPKKSAIKKSLPVPKYTPLNFDDEFQQKQYPDGSNLPKTGIVKEFNTVQADFRHLQISGPKITNAQATARYKAIQATMNRLAKADYEAPDSVSFNLTRDFFKEKSKMLAEQPVLHLRHGVIVRPVEKKQTNKKRTKERSSSSELAEKRPRNSDTDPDSFESDISDPDYVEE